MIHLYLDFDGVLNHHAAREIGDLLHCDRDSAGHLAGPTVSGSVFSALQKMSIYNIQNFRRAIHYLKELNPRIVVTSSWRKTLSQAEMTTLMDAVGLTGLLHSYTEETPDSLHLMLPVRRAFEIRKHMGYYDLKLSQIAIIDDMHIFDLQDPEQSRFVHTSPWSGFDPHAAHQLIRLFRPRWKPDVDRK